MEDFIHRFHITDDFWGHYEQLLTDVVIPYQERALRDQIPDAEKSHAIENFELAARYNETGDAGGTFYGMVFQDSDLAKWIEACAYALIQKPDPDLKSRVEQIIDLIGRAQLKDGYLNTYYIVKAPQYRWTNLQEGHELYCAGHMIEAACAWYASTGEKNLLEIVCRLADHIYDRFITKGCKGYPGHPEIELALMRLYETTGERKYEELAAHFIDVRGVDPDYFLKEHDARGWEIWGMDPLDRKYAINHKPVRELDQATGHAVRAVYLYSGMADLARETKDQALMDALHRLWDNITNKQMYITGGIGQTGIGEAFSTDYNLPDDTAYCETCASIGLIFFARRMLELETDGRYADVMEQALYNTVLAGMQLDGKRFFYVNPLEVIPGISGEIVTHIHDLPERPKWYGCACCPPNVARTVTSLAKYAWGERADEPRTLYQHLYVGGELKEPYGLVRVKTGYPYDGQVDYEIEGDVTLKIRIPSWSRDTHLSVDGIEVPVEPVHGYQTISGAKRITLRLDMSIRRYYANPKVSSDSGKTALMRGPFVYCAEGKDNRESVLDLKIKAHGSVRTVQSEDFYGVVNLKAEGVRVKATEELYTTKEPVTEDVELTLIPYYTWGNRGLNEMRVWLPYI